MTTRTNLLQSEDYLRAMAQLNRQRISSHTVTIDGQDAGLYNILEAGLFKNAIHAVILDRGPVWFEGFGTPAHFESFVQDFAQKYPKRLGRRIRFIPEQEDTPRTRQIMRDAGYKPGSADGYETVWLDLQPDEDILRKNLNPKWRNKLHQSDRKNLELVWSDSGIRTPQFKWLMTQYLRDRQERGYNGPSAKTVIALGEQFSRGKNMLTALALLDKTPIAGILLFIHGASATYQIGYTSAAGRENRAHYALLWDAFLKLKERQVRRFDLGGVNDENAKGVKTFKQGTGGTVEKTLGIYH